MDARRLNRPSIVPFLALLVALALLSTACAATLRDNIRKSALIAGEAALTIDQTERDLAATNPPGYTPEKRKQVNDAIVLMLTACRNYERVARAWPEQTAMPTDVPGALDAALKAIAMVEQLVAGIPGNAKLLANINLVKSKIGGL